MTQNVDAKEIAKFAALSSHWWDPTGELKTLHQLNPVRLGYIKEKVNLTQANVIDIGCGGGILSESMAQAGAKVTGIDLNQPVLDIAKLHLLESGTQVDYQLISVEDMALKNPAAFDVVTCLEMLEHVPDPASVVKACAALVKPGGHVFFSTLNRNPKSYLFAIIGAEYLLKLLPKNTHDYAKFIRPAELNNWVRQAGLATIEMKGVSYHPLKQTAALTTDISVNYLLYARKLTAE